MSALQKLRKRYKNLAGVVAAVFLLMWSFWQLDINAGGAGALAVHWFEPFGFYLVSSEWALVTTRGVAYDVTLTCIAASFIVLFVSMWFWED